MKRLSSKFKTSIIISVLYLSAFSPAYTFDLGKALSNAVEDQIANAKGKAKDKAIRKINDLVMTTVPPKLAKHARLDDRLPVDLSKGVYIFGHQGCPPTRQAYAFMKRNGIKYRNMDVARDKKAVRIANERRVTGYPTLYVNGEKIVGFGSKSYTALLRKHKKIK